MKSITEISEIKDRRVILSTLWIFVTANYIFCDVLSNMMPDVLRGLIETGEVEGISLTQGFLLGSAIFMEIPFVMILLSRVLKYRANRLTNIIAGSIMSAAQIVSLFIGPPALHYIFYSVIEIGCTLIIVWYAWKWHKT